MCCAAQQTRPRCLRVPQKPWTLKQDWCVRESVCAIGGCQSVLTHCCHCNRLRFLASC